MSGLPSVSVVIPARNALRRLPGAIASIGGGEVEILVVDDCSTDGSWEYLESISRADPRIRPLRAPAPGLPASQNAGVAQARAALTAFLFPDDRWRPDMLRRQLLLHRQNPQIGFSFTECRRLAEDGTELPSGFARCPHFAARHAMRREGFVLDSDAQAQIYAEPVVVTSTVFVKTRLLHAVGGFNEALGRGGNWDLWLHLAACARVGCLPRPLADHLIRAMGPRGREALARRAVRRRVAAAYASAALAQHAAALRLCRASQLLIEAEEAALAGRNMRAALLQLGALARHPDRTLNRAAALDLFRPRPAAAPERPQAARGSTIASS